VTQADDKLQYFEQVSVQRPADVIIDQIRKLIRAGKLNPGDKLPSERALGDRFGVGRTVVRQALQKLEFYGILHTEPHKGTIVASLGVKALDGLISNLLLIDRSDAISLFDTRVVLEVHAAATAAQQGRKEEIEGILVSHREFMETIKSGGAALEQDHLFHLKIAESTHNSVLSSLIGLLTPDIIAMNRDFKESAPEARKKTLKEHEGILEGIRIHDPDIAAAAMKKHMERARARRFGEEE